MLCCCKAILLSAKYSADSLAPAFRKFERGMKRSTLIKAAPKSKNVADAPGNVEGMDVTNPCSLMFKLVASMSTFATDAFCNKATPWSRNCLDCHLTWNDTSLCVT